MNGLKRATKFQNLDIKSSFAWFWGTMILVDIVSYLLNKYFVNISGGINIGIHINDGINSTSIAGANLWVMVIFFVVYSYENYYEYFPVALGFSITRKDFYKSVVFDNIRVIFAFSIIQSILMKIDKYIVSTLNNVTPIVDFKIFNTETDNIFIMIISLFIVFIAINSIFNLLAALNYKFGYKLWIVIGVISSLSIMLIGNTFFSIIEWILRTRVTIIQFILLIVITIIMYVVGYFSSKSINIKSKLG